MNQVTGVPTFEYHRQALWLAAFQMGMNSLFAFMSRWSLLCMQRWISGVDRIWLIRRVHAAMAEANARRRPSPLERTVQASSRNHT